MGASFFIDDNLLLKNLKNIAKLQEYQSFSKKNDEDPKLAIFNGKELLYNSNSKAKLAWTYGYSLIKFKNFIDKKKSEFLKVYE